MYTIALRNGDRLSVTGSQATARAACSLSQSSESDEEMGGVGVDQRSMSYRASAPRVSTVSRCSFSRLGTFLFTFVCSHLGGEAELYLVSIYE